MKGVNRKRQKKGLGKGESGNNEWERTMEQRAKGERMGNGMGKARRGSNKEMGNGE